MLRNKMPLNMQGPQQQDTRNQSEYAFAPPAQTLNSTFAEIFHWGTR